jgi:hypothetical protein
VNIAAALFPSVLTGFLDGSRLTVSNVLIFHNAFIEVRAPGSRAFILAYVSLKLTRFRSLISTTIKLLAEVFMQKVL